MVHTLKSANSFSCLDKFLAELTQEIMNSQASIQNQNLEIWDYLGAYYREHDIKYLENPIKPIMLEVVLASLIVWLLEDFLGNVPKSFPNYYESIKKAKQAGILFDLAFTNRLTDSFHIAQKLKINLMKVWEFLATLDMSELLEEDFLGTMIQNLLPQNLRKALAANYTSLVSARFLAALSIKEDIEKIIDPFSGSGRLLTALNQEYSYKKVLKRPSIALNELLDLAAYLAAAQIIYFQKSQGINPLITMHFGDAFSKLKPPFKFENKAVKYLEKAQMVIMNPPFTRYLRLSNHYLETLNKVCKSYAKHMSPQMGLHVFSLFLADSLLTSGGRIAAILPASTFYSKYSEGLKEFLLARYQIRAIVGTSTDKSFSEASDLKEIIFIADKRKRGEKPIKSILFVTLNEELTHDSFRTIANTIWKEMPSKFNIKFRRVPHSEL
ncbi:MAG: Eco57I restriction-modification methylase domain-containing protein, partial [Candidatus Hodarchaeota archaeon]